MMIVNTIGNTIVVMMGLGYMMVMMIWILIKR